MLNIILCGAPGCGKGTQSSLLKKHFKLEHFSTGDILRAEIKAGTEQGLIANEFISKGMLVPDEMIIEMLMKQIYALPADVHGMILDGFPRTVNQAIELEKTLNEKNLPTNFLIDLIVEEKELISRLIERGKISGRSDDNAETIKKRLEVYNEITTPVNDFYKNLDKYIAVNGMGTVDEIFERIKTVLKEK